MDSADYKKAEVRKGQDGGKGALRLHGWLLDPRLLSGAVGLFSVLKINVSQMITRNESRILPALAGPPTANSQTWSFEAPGKKKLVCTRNALGNLFSQFILTHTLFCFVTNSTTTLIFFFKGEMGW